ncbi:glycine/sarcosine/betaine reductase complex component C subunit beta [Desulfovibrio intestinalis]|uniref:Betaine reductase n=1 Tax=Desulfovibrio intestinalis TaxID=58621 RepID=A0A7W8C2H7_9BACT|nr:glycine/sarcosine/betaine reductase complex component C subunit beta [Desulfovibrio intestinalis]MBB5142994.1 betaine reductase [Desulfovibrio intestinalis]
MTTVGIKAAAYCLNFAPELALHYGGTPAQERKTKPDSEFLRELPKHAQTWEQAAAYAPNKTYVGSMSLEELEKAPAPWIDNLGETQRFGKFGEIMPEDEFIGLMDICDVFDLIWLEKKFAAAVAVKLAQNPVMGEKQLARLEKGRPEAELLEVIEKHHALPLYIEGKLVGCCRRAHDTDENLEAGVMLENMASKASGVLALLHLIKNAGMAPTDVDFVVECSEEAVGDAMQRGGGNMAKALAEIAECVNASGFDVRGFCAGPVAALITSASMVASGVRPNVVVVSGGSVPKLYMNARDHIKKGVVPLENCIGSFALLLTPDDGQTPVMRLDGIGKHTVGAGASPQAITTAITFDPLASVGLKLTDVDKYAPELHNAEVTLPAGAGNVPEANYKMIAALAVMKGQIERGDIPKFVAERGMPGFAPIQGHIPSGVPYVGHAIEAIKEGRIKRAMIIGKGSLFLGRLTNLADGASFIMEAPGAGAAKVQSVSQQDVTEMLLTALGDMAANLQKGQ